MVVYGGTAGGMIAAVSAAREGLNVALLEPGKHLGGMVSGGLSWTDFGKKEVIGGYALEFYWRAGRHYQMSRYGQEIAWMHELAGHRRYAQLALGFVETAKEGPLYEPHVAVDIFRQMLREARVTVLLEHRLPWRRESRVSLRPGRSVPGRCGFRGRPGRAIAA